MTLVIAEAGVNHNGDEDLAMQLVDIAYKSGADIVKFQTFKAKKLTTNQTVKAHYQKSNTNKNESQLEMLSRLELSYDSFIRIKEKCDSLGIEFLSTAFDTESLTFLIENVGLKRLKIPSGEITNLPLVLEHAYTGKDIILSTGMSSISEIESALSVIAFGYTSDKKLTPSIEAFEEAYASQEGQKALKEKVTILHCTTEYPAPIEEVNLKAINTLKKTFGLRTGYSDHTKGNHIAIAAVALGASVLEKHFTIDRLMEGPDHKSSLEPNQLSDLVKNIRDIEQVLGDGIKRATISECRNKITARKSLVALKDISEGEKYNKESIGIKRPGNGVSPKEYWNYLNKTAPRNYIEGEIIE